MKGILNETTATVHRRETGRSDLHTACGVAYTLNPEKLRPVSIDRVSTERGVDKCGRCFDDGGSY